MLDRFTFGTLHISDEFAGRRSRRLVSRKPTPPEPDRPTVHRCKLCSSQVYVAIDRLGFEVVVDASPLRMTVERDVIGTKAVVRVAARHELARATGGYRILDPQLFHGLPDAIEQAQEHSVRRPFILQCVGEKAPTPVSEPEWQWFVNPVPLADAYALGQTVYSDHIMTCSGIDDRRLVAKLTTGHRDEKRQERRVTRRTRDGAAIAAAAKRLESAALSVQTPATDQTPVVVREDKRGQLAMW